ncbi:class I SAM-dependent methyltransferase [Leifsonia shinshuensis]|nr:class I SAM-dependent methyltransferase [Leifsonia shinshuensis]
MGRVGARVLSALARFSAQHPWSHNDAYGPWVLWHARRTRRGGSAALDVGCGTGNLVRKLAGVMGEVTGIEQDTGTAARARANLAHIDNADVREESFDLSPDEQPRYDLVSFVAVLHHLPLEPALRAARSVLRPGGCLVIVGLARETPADLPRSLASVFLNAAVGAVRHPRRAVAEPENMTAPTAEPLETFEQIEAVARDVLPGVKMRRRLFWRYTAVWVAPAAGFGATVG